jgi:hypothetical protein
MDPNQPKVRCPYCGAHNAMGSNVCGGCMKDIRRLANPDRADFEETSWEPSARPKARFRPWRKFRRWLKRLFRPS